MFTQISLKNFRTHVDLTLDLGPLTLITGNNNSGKTNLFFGIVHFKQLVRRFRPNQWDDPATAEYTESYTQLNGGGDLFPHRHRLCHDSDPMGFSCFWEKPEGYIKYSVELLKDPSLPDQVAGYETIEYTLHINGLTEVIGCAGEDRANLGLQLKLARDTSLSREGRELIRQFFLSLGQIYYYHLQPAYLKQLSQESLSYRKRLNEKVRIPAELGREGGGLQSLLRRVKQTETRTFDRCIQLLRRFEKDFFGVLIDGGDAVNKWQFDLRNPKVRLDEFLPDLVSDGLLKAAAVALLCSMARPPAMILVEEIENGISPANIQEFLGWLRQVAPSGSSDVVRENAPQFMLSSHSPSVLRAFSDHSHHVYTLHLNRRGFKTTVTNLEKLLRILMDVGSLEADIKKDSSGVERIHITPGQITELWYSGAIG